jgi:hypothetical protein
MIRTPNPGSDLDQYIRIYQTLFKVIGADKTFTLDDISYILATNGLTASCGYSGEEGLKRSNRDDRSRDPMYNQSKMYSELFRLLGWMHPVDGQLNFQNTWLGAKIAEGGPAVKPLTLECVLAITYPNFAVSANPSHKCRPFKTILQVANMLGGKISMDEMIIGPLSLPADSRKKDLEECAEKLKALRGVKRGANNEALRLAKTAGTQYNTFKNYTRLPIAMLKWSGWVTQQGAKGKDGTNYFELSDLGKRTAKLVEGYDDLRADKIEKAKSSERAVLAELGAIMIIERAGINISQYDKAKKILTDSVKKSGLADVTKSILFSPFIQLEPNECIQVFGGPSNTKYNTAKIGNSANQTSGRDTKTSATTINVQDTDTERRYSIKSSPMLEALAGCLAKHKTASKAALAFKTSYCNSNKDVFYPLVADLFSIIGFDCKASRHGVNYERSDAFISHPKESIPIEIKSPGEELNISTKGVRQALENKVILLSREYQPTLPETTSLVVGFDLPNSRAEVADLIHYIKITYDINIGVIDFQTLTKLALQRIEGREAEVHKLFRLYGFMQLKNI